HGQGPACTARSQQSIQIVGVVEVEGEVLRLRGDRVHPCATRRPEVLLERIATEPRADRFRRRPDERVGPTVGTGPGGGTRGAPRTRTAGTAREGASAGGGGVNKGSSPTRTAGRGPPASTAAVSTWRTARRSVDPSSTTVRAPASSATSSTTSSPEITQVS